MARFFGNTSRREELLSASLDGRLSPRERAYVERMLARSAEWRAELESLRATVALLQAAPRLQPRRSFAVTPDMAKAPAPRESRRLLRPATAIATAAAALLLTFSLVGGAADLFSRSVSRPSAPEPTVPASAEAVPTFAPAPQGAPQPAASERRLPEGLKADGVRGAGAPPTPQPAPALPASGAPSGAVGQPGPPGPAARQDQAPTSRPEAGAPSLTGPEQLKAPAIEEKERGFPWLALEIAFGAVTGLLCIATLWAYRRARARP